MLDPLNTDNYIPMSSMDMRAENDRSARYKLPKKFNLNFLYIFVFIFTFALVGIVANTNLNKRIQDRLGVSFANLETFTIPVEEDSFISSDTASTIHVSNPQLRSSRYKDAPQRAAFFNFDLTPYTGKEVVNAKFRFELEEIELAASNSNGTLSKSIRVVPYTNLANFTFNSSIQLTPEGNQIGSKYPVHQYMNYPVIETFIAANTQNNPELEAQYRAKVTPTTNNSNRAGIVEIDLGDAIKDLAGHKFTLVIEDQRWAKSTKIYSKQTANNNALKPELIVTTDNAPVAINRENLNVGSVAQCSMNDVFLKNGFKGLYNWRTVNLNPNYVPASDVYQRFDWNELELASGNYSGIDSKIQPYLDSLQPGQKFSFRVRAMASSGNAMPSYMSSYVQTCTDGTNVPDWNNPEVIARANALIAELARRYNNDDRIGWIDIGFTGRYGENQGACSTSITEQSKRAYVDMYTNNFTKVQLLTMTDDEYIAGYALSKPANEAGKLIGFRRDSQGADNVQFGEMAVKFDEFKYLKDRWKYAPLITEFGGASETSGEPVNQTDSMWDLSLMELSSWHVSAIGNGNIANDGPAPNPFDSPIMVREQNLFNQIGRNAGATLSLKEWGVSNSIIENTNFNLYTNWLNLGNAPLYEDYKLVFILKNQTTGQVREYLLNQNLKTILPTKNLITNVEKPREFLEELVAPSTGTYEAFIKVIDAKETSPYKRNPLNLCNLGEQTDDSYALGTVTITSAPVNQAPDGAINSPSTSPINVTVGGAINFEGSGTDPENVTTGLTYIWNFGGGALDTNQQNPGSVIFNTVGTYNVSLTVSDSQGLADPTPAMVTVNVTAVVPSPTPTPIPSPIPSPTPTPLPSPTPTPTPVPSPTPSPTPTVNLPPNGDITYPTQDIVIDKGTAVTFQSTASDPEDGAKNLRYSWQLNNSSPFSTSKTPRYTFRKTGTFVIKLTVKDSQGLADPTPDTVTVTVVEPSATVPDF